MTEKVDLDRLNLFKARLKDYSNEHIRICRDHAVKAKLELARVLSKLPDMKWDTGEAFNEKIGLTELLIMVTELSWILDSIYAMNRPKKGKLNNRKHSKKERRKIAAVRHQHQCYLPVKCFSKKKEPARKLLRVSDKEKLES